MLLAVPVAASAQVDPYTGAGVAPPTSNCPTAAPVVTLSTYVTQVGDTIIATTTGQRPGSAVTLYLDGTAFASRTTDAGGRFSSPLRVPAGPSFVVCTTSPPCLPACTDPGRVVPAATSNVLGESLNRGFARTGLDVGLMVLIALLLIAVGRQLRRTRVSAR